MSDPEAGRRAPETVSVFGSCVTRDNFNSRFNPSHKDHFEVVLSANQSSVIALMSPPIEERFEITRGLSDYDIWNIGSDLRREFLAQVVELQPDYLILDFFGDVHFGVARLADGRYLTDNRWKTHFTDLYERHRDTGDLTRLSHGVDAEAYFALWTEALDRFAAFIAGECPQTVVIVHHGYNTSRVLVPGAPRPLALRDHVKLSAFNVKGANAFWARLDDYAIQSHGWESIDLRGLEAPSYAEHPWGPFWVHYTPDYYHRFLAEMHKISLRRRVDPATWDEIELIEAASREPAERRLAVEVDVVADQRSTIKHAHGRVHELESLGVLGGLRFAVGQRLRARRGTKHR